MFWRELRSLPLPKKQTCRLRLERTVLTKLRREKSQMLTGRMPAILMTSSYWALRSWYSVVRRAWVTPVEWGRMGEGDLSKKKKRAQINSVGWQHTQVENNKTKPRPVASAAPHPNTPTKHRPVASTAPHPNTPTNKAQASRFCSTIFQHSSEGGLCEGHYTSERGIKWKTYETEKPKINFVWGRNICLPKAFRNQIIQLPNMKILLLPWTSLRFKKDRISR